MNGEALSGNGSNPEGYDLKQATEYLETGGLGEVIGFTDLARQQKSQKVQMDTDMAMALCLLASEALNKRRAH